MISPKLMALLGWTTCCCCWRTAGAFAVQQQQQYQQRRRSYRIVLSHYLFGSGGSDSGSTESSLSAAAEEDTTTIIQEQISLGREKLQSYFHFPLDDWQLQAGGAICQGQNVIVCAPTGAGKTVIGEMALLHAYYDNHCAGIYTTPLKALSNQKYIELCQTFGKADTGLSTGDVSINKGASITVMTTEVYRNMAWRSCIPNHGQDSYDYTRRQQQQQQQQQHQQKDELQDNAVVVLDEFHYMGHPGRGGVWEECIITSPAHTQIVGLSATLANAPALAAWMEHVTNRTTVLVQVPGSERPVPLRYLYATKDGLFPLFRDPDAGPGAPKGLLGYRGDYGIIKPTAADLEGPLRRRKKSSLRIQTMGFGAAAEQAAQKKEQQQQPSVVEKLPRGIQVNPALRAAAAKRLQRVQRSLERQKVQWRMEQDRGKNAYDADDDWNFRRDMQRSPSRRLSPKEENRERERLLKNEMRRAVPSLFSILNRLRQKDLLPAIFFIFSRAGCDEAARTLHNYMKGPRDFNRRSDDEIESDSEDEIEGSPGIVHPRRKRKSRQRGRRRGELLEDSDGRTFRSGSNYVDEELLASIFEDDGELLDEDAVLDESSPLSSQNWKYYAEAGLLDYKQVREVASRISSFNEQNDEIAFDDEIIEQYLFGVGSHHAGRLPAHKSFVEALYRNNLMFVVFATETLAAGINMPARTTVVCSLAKRGGDGSSMSLLGTSDLLQMAGRAGRRGMDTDGTCVIVATPFETHDDAAKILTDPIKPITSQFSPSYGLAVNLIARGEGKLDVARQLVSKSFAMWEKQQVEENLAEVVETLGDGVSDVLQASAQERFMTELVDALQYQVDKRRAQSNNSKITAMLDILGNRELLKKTSKSFIGADRMLELEQTTLRYLERELGSMKSLQNEEDKDLLGDMINEDEQCLIEQIETQRKRTMDTEQELQKHPFTAIANIANEIMSESTPQATVLTSTLRSARIVGEVDASAPLSPQELSEFAKSVIVIQRKARKLAKGNPGLDTKALLEQADKVEQVRDDSWDDMISITETLVAYGCLSTVSPMDKIPDLEKETFGVTQAGLNVGMLGFENSLWTLAAIGGTWDVIGASTKLDQYRIAMNAYVSDDDSFDWYDNNVQSTSATSTETGSQSQQEADRLVELLRSLPPNELAGYVASLVADNSRNNGLSVLESFERLSPTQQRVIQQSLLVMERLAEIQKQYSVDEITRNCIL